MGSPVDATEALLVRRKVQLFLEAACAGNLDVLKELLVELDVGKGPSKTAADVKDANCRTAFHFAAREGRTEVCRFFIEELNLKPDPRDDDGETPLIHAARKGHCETVKFLADNGANPCAATCLGATALHHAAGIGSIELIELLLSMDVDVESESDAGTPLIWAAGHGQEKALKFLLEHHANPNAETDDRVTPLLSAVAAGSHQCLELLIQAGATPNINVGGTTPLHVAADLGNEKVIKCLLNAGADPNKCDDDGLKPIHAAAMRSNSVAVDILLPVTSPVPDITDWTTGGIIKHMLSLAEKEQGHANGYESSKDRTLEKKQIIEVSPEAKEKSLEAKSRADEAFKRKEYQMALDAYTQAIELNQNDAVLFSNRSLCWLRLGQGERALEDAQACRVLRSDWAKAHYREGAALQLLQRYTDAANAFYEGVRLDPENQELVSAFREAVDLGKKIHGTDEPKP